MMAKREDRIREAASLQVKIGQLQRYCELMVELGEVNLRILKPLLHRTRDKKRKAICFMLENLAVYFLRIELSKGQARLMTYFRGTQREHSSKPREQSIVKRILVYKR